MIEPVDYDAWLSYTASLVRTPGGAALWSVAKSVITPTVSAVIDDHLKRNPNQPSFLELNSLFKTEPAEDRSQPSSPGSLGDIA